MPIIDGPTLDKAARETRDWYNATRLRLIADLERDGYPYGTVKLSQEEQLFKYLAMTPKDWSDMTQRLLSKYRGQPDALRHAGADMQRYRDQMERLKMKMEEAQGRPQATSMESMAGSMMRNAGFPEVDQENPEVNYG